MIRPRLTLGIAQAGFDGEQFGALLRSHRMEPEYLSDTGCVLRSPPLTGRRIGNGCAACWRHCRRGNRWGFPVPEMALPLGSGLTLRQALLAEQEQVEVGALEGRIWCLRQEPLSARHPAGCSRGEN